MFDETDLRLSLERLGAVEKANPKLKRDRATTLTLRLNRTGNTRQVAQMLMGTMLLYLEEL